MIDLTFIREHPDIVRQALADLNSAGPLDEILALDQQRRDLLGEVEALRAERNRVSKEIPRIKDAAEKQRQIEEMRQVGERIKDAGGAAAAPWRSAWIRRCWKCPTCPTPACRWARTRRHNVVVRQVGELPAFAFRAAAPLGPGRGAGHHRLRARASRSRARAFTCSRARARGCSGR